MVSALGPEPPPGLTLRHVPPDGVVTDADADQFSAAAPALPMFTVCDAGLTPGPEEVNSTLLRSTVMRDTGGVTVKVTGTTTGDMAASADVTVMVAAYVPI